MSLPSKKATAKKMIANRFAFAEHYNLPSILIQVGGSLRNLLQLPFQMSRSLL